MTWLAWIMTGTEPNTYKYTLCSLYIGRVFLVISCMLTLYLVVKLVVTTQKSIPVHPSDYVISTRP